MNEMYFMIGATMVGYLGLVVGFILLATIVKRIQVCTKGNTDAIWGLKVAIEKMALTHHTVEQKINEECQEKVEEMTATTDAKFEFIRDGQDKMKKEIIDVIDNSFKEFANTFGARLSVLEYEVAEIKKEIENHE